MQLESCRLRRSGLSWLTAVVFVAVLASCGDRNGSSDDGAPGPKPVVLDITLHRPDGSTDSAHISCLGEIKGTGYLDGAAADACITALTSPLAVDLLRAGSGEPNPSCDRLTKAYRQGNEPLRSSGTATISGTYEAEPINLNFKATGSECDQARWWVLEPLFHKLGEPRIVD